MRSKCNAFTLLEMMLALALSSVLMLGLTGLYHTVRLNENAIVHMAAKVERERFLLLFLKAQIQTDSAPVVSMLKKSNTPRWISRKQVQSDILILHRTETVAYYLDKTSWDSNILALYQKRKGGRREELLPNIEQMQVKLCYQHDGSDLLCRRSEHVSKNDIIKGVYFNFQLQSGEHKPLTAFAFFVGVPSHAA